MRILAALCGLLVCSNALAQKNVDPKQVIVPQPEERKVPLWDARFDTDYTFDSDFEDVESLGSISTLHYSATLARRFALTDRWYFKVGFNADRIEVFDASGPIPDSLNQLAGIVAIEYWKKGRLGFILQSNPGVYFTEDITGNAFDAPTFAAVAIKVHEKFSFVLGAGGSIMGEGIFGGSSISPVAGFYWNATERLTLNAVLPQPRITYKISEAFSVYAGGEYSLGTYRTSESDDRRTNNAVMRYRDIRAGIGASYHPTEGVALELSAGWSFNRQFDYYRSGPGFETEGAPYLRASLKIAL
jgi:hypothetical protein